MHRLRGVPSVDQAALVAGFRALGLPRGAHVVCHTALSSFGQVEGGPAALISALLDVVGPAGTIVAPTATWRSCYLRTPAEPIPGHVRPYDPAGTPPDADMGRVPATLWGWLGARRTPHPLMSVTAVGALAATLAAEHPIDDPLRPYRTLAAHGGWVLLLGVDHTRNTTIHAAEFLANLPHLTGPGYAAVHDPRAPDGARVLTIPREPDCSLGFDALDGVVPRREAQIGGCIAWLLAGQAVIDGALALLAQNPGALLCDHPSCRTCGRGRRLYAAAPPPAAR